MPSDFSHPHPSPVIRRWFETLSLPVDYPSQFQLSPVEECNCLVEIGQDVFDRDQRMDPHAAKSWHAMQSAALADGVSLLVVSAYRSFDYQAKLIQSKLEKGQCLEEILRVSAAPGFSEHHTGRALDLTTKDEPPLEQSFAQTDAHRWLGRHAKSFGFVESFGPENPHGIIWEPWHWCYRPFLIAE